MGWSFELESQRFSAFDGSPHFSFPEGMSQLVSCTQEEIDHYYEKLSEGGEQQPCGRVKDRFSVSRQIVPPILMQLLSDPNREKAGRAMNVMLRNA